MASQKFWSHCPTWISRWIGIRSSPQKSQATYAIYLWSFIGAFCGLALLQAIFGHTQYFLKRGVPSIIGSYGASAVLCYGSIDAPFAQPRALIGGHFLSGLIGVCIGKLFGLLPTEEQFHSLSWLSASLATAVAIVVMQATKTVHPPAGASALFPILNPDVRGLSWYYLPVLLLSSSLVLVTALLLNNVQRQYPKFWIAPEPAVKVMPDDTKLKQFHIENQPSMVDGVSNSSEQTLNGRNINMV